MNNLNNDLSSRENEIEEYFELIKLIEGGELFNRNNEKIEISSSLMKTLKGAVFLLLYNLVESTMREAISSIHDSIASSGCGYDDIRSELKEELWRRAIKGNIGIKGMVSRTSGGIS
ncbi:MAG: MAE_28990/MAE_18760 family HEPN-like nuclease, partial [Reinekea sp.]